MNRLHHWLCRSHRWRRTLAHRLPWALAGADLGDHILELGPGPGLTTDLLQTRAARLTAIEINPLLAESLRSRLSSDSVHVVTGDAVAMPFPDEHFSAAVCFTMLHHLPSAACQAKLLREVRRVLRPGGVFAGCDSLQSLYMRLIHIGDTLVPIDPNTFGARLQAAGLEAVHVERNSEAFRFQGHRPSSAEAQLDQSVKLEGVRP
jgi:ubiquinone/menaquinone biosynthesis C-methylase UbiE